MPPFLDTHLWVGNNIVVKTKHGSAVFPGDKHAALLRLLALHTLTAAAMTVPPQ